MTTSPHDANWLNEYPVTDTYELASGKTFAVPYKCRNAQPLYLYGTVGIDASRALLAKQNYNPVKFGESSSISALAAVDYIDTSCGSYHELFWTFLVSKQSLSFPDDGTPMAFMAAASHPDVVSLCYKLFLDQQFAIDVGREVFSLPKDPTPQHLEAGIDGQHFQFKLACEGHLTLRARVELPTQFTPRARSKMTLVSSTEVNQTRMLVDLETAMGIRSFESSDELFISPEVDFGRQLIGLNFQPKLVVYMPNASLVIPKPLNWQKPSDAAGQ